MKFIGNANQLKTFFDILIAIFGEDATVKKVESRIKEMRVEETCRYITH